MLARLVRAAQLMDTLFLRQDWAGNEPMLLALLEDATPAGRARLRRFLVNKGPWDKMGVVRPEVQKILDQLSRVPVDIEPRFVTADKLLH